MHLIVYILVSFLFGFVFAWVVRTVYIFRLKKELKQTEGLLESERLIKETLRKENALAFQLKANIESELGEKLLQYQHVVKQMDEDILLLQKNNEEVENAFRENQPELYELKMRLIEAQNNINRLKSLLQNNVDGK